MIASLGPVSASCKSLQTLRSCNTSPSNLKHLWQGQERRVIIVSAVRSTEEYITEDLKYKLGLLKNPKRFNVAVTRAQALLIVVGNPRVLAGDRCWGALLRHCVRRGGYTGAELPLGFSVDDGDDDVVDYAMLEEAAAALLGEEEDGEQLRESERGMQEGPAMRFNM